MPAKIQQNQSIGKQLIRDCWLLACNFTDY